MKTSLELPEPLLQQIRQRAEREGRTIDDVVAEMLMANVLPYSKADLEDGIPVGKTLPRIKVRPIQATAIPALTAQEWCDWIKNADVQLEVDRHEKALGHQHVDRADA